MSSISGNLVTHVIETLKPNRLTKIECSEFGQNGNSVLVDYCRLFIQFLIHHTQRLIQNVVKILKKGLGILSGICTNLGRSWRVRTSKNLRPITNSVHLTAPIFSLRLSVIYTEFHIKSTSATSLRNFFQLLHVQNL